MNQNKRNWVAAFLLISMFFMSAVYATQGALLSSMIDAFSLTGINQGTANSVTFTGSIIALITAFSLQGRFRKRFILVVSMLISVVGLVFLWGAPSYALYVATWAAIGFGLGLMDTVLSACMADLYTGDTGTLMMCMLHTAFGLSSVLMPMAYNAMMAHGISWKQIYLIVGFFGSTFLLVSTIIKTKKQIRDVEVLTPESHEIKAIAESISRDHLIGLVAAMFFQGVYLSGLNTWINRYADTLSVLSIPAQSCLFFGVMVSRMIMPFLPIKADRYVKLGAALGAVVLAAGLLTHNGLILRIALAVGGFLAGAMIPCMLSIGCERNRKNTLLVTTAMMLALYLGQCISSPLIGILESSVGLEAGIYLCVICMLACSLCNWPNQSDARTGR
ncbi:MAG: MFS transporter [Clostridia bacterium]|nr:MFS transporter [Clostridia bacterium]